MLLAADCGLLAVWMVREEGLVESLPNLAVVLSQGHILLLVDGFKLGVEAADDIMTETVCLNFRPVLDLVRRDVLSIDSLISRGPGIGTVRAD